MDIALQCRNWQSLPEGGGVIEQDLQLMTDVEQALAILDAYHKWQNLRHEDFLKYPELEKYIWNMNHYRKTGEWLDG